MTRLRVGVTASRKGGEVVTAFERRGAWVLHGPTLGGDQPAADTDLGVGLDRLAARAPEWFVASTGMGMRVLGQAAARTSRREVLVDMLGRAMVAARGAKAVGELRRLGIAPAWVAPDELDSQIVDWLTPRARPADTVAVQLHGAGGHPYSALTASGFAVQTVTPYVSTPPANPQPGVQLAAAAAAGDLDVVTFTSAGAARGLADLAEAAGLGGQVRAALSGPVAVAVVGPVTHAAAAGLGYTPEIAPATHRSGALIRAVLDWWHTRS